MRVDIQPTPIFKKAQEEALRASSEIENNSQSYARYLRTAGRGIAILLFSGAVSALTITGLNSLIRQEVRPLNPLPTPEIGTRDGEARDVSGGYVPTPRPIPATPTVTVGEGYGEGRDVSAGYFGVPQNPNQPLP